MFPISLNLAAVPILLLGEGAAFEKRKAQLLACGASHPAFVAGSGWRMWHDIPQQVRDDSHIIMLAGLDDATCERIAHEARTHKKLVNVEDVPELCDFYFMSFVQRGELTIAVSTNGASPTLAKRVREKIAAMFGPEWAGYLEQTKQLRLRLRGEGKSMKEVMVASDDFINVQGWIDQTPRQARS